MAAVKTLIGNVKGPQGEKGEKGDTGPAGSTGIRGSRWAEGTAITGTSTEGTIFPDTGITDALVGDMYLNTSTGNVYRCTESGAASAARWVHTGNLKGPTGERGASGETGPKGDTGIRGSRIYQGTAVTGTSSTSEIFSGSGISDAMVDDVYINTADGNTYKCTVPGPAETARWAYTGCIRGAAGEAPEAADDMTVGFSASSERTNINTGEKMSTLMGKIKKWFADMTVAAFAQVISSNTDLMANTLPGYLVDALAVRQQFEAVNSNLGNMNKIPYFLGAVTAVGETISFNLIEYREIIFRVSIGGGTFMYQTIPTPAVQSGHAEITFSEENMFFTILCYIGDNGIEFLNIISSWSAWAIQLIGIK